MSDESLQQAHALHMSGRLDRAAMVYGQILQADPDNITALIYLGMLRLQRGQFPDAEALLAKAVGLDPNALPALSLRAAALQQLGRRQEAVASLDRLLQLQPATAQAWNNRGGILLEMGRIDEAVQSFDRAIAIDSAYAEAWHNRAVARVQLQDYAQAKADLDQAILLKPDYADALEHRGLVLLRLGRFEQALESCEAALRLQPNSAEAWHIRGNIGLAQNNYAEALFSYDQALKIAPGNAEALNSRGTLRNHLQRHADALTDFDRALAIRRDDAAAWQGRANALARLNHEDEALASYDEALRLQPKDPTALFNRASLLAQALRYEDARRDIDTLLQTNADYPLARGLSLHIRLNSCDWDGLREARDDIAAAVRSGKRAIYPFGHAMISESPEEQLRCAEITAAASYPLVVTPLWRGESYRHQKLRVAYLSGDFCVHPVAFLVAGVFEHHDKERFDIFGISYAPDDGSEIRRRMEQAFTRFVDVREMTDAAVAEMLRELEIDIVIDLKGYTSGGRPEVLAYRPAPVQVQYLGYPGTMGADYIDYLIADRIVIPDADRASYSEQIVYLPDTYQSNDSRRRIAAGELDRVQAGLPERGFVFCCFNGSQKILPETFGLWMDILSRVEDSVLWLFEEHPLATANLWREAQARGVSAERLIFATRLPLEKHLARLQLADLVLDTLPYGAHTTASDALWAGVPVLTKLGTTFAGRVAASLLHAIGLPELITDSDADYVSRACELAQSDSLLANIKARLRENRHTMPLFDTARITRHLESVYNEMKARHDRGEPPQSFSITG